MKTLIVASFALFTSVAAYGSCGGSCVCTAYIWCGNGANLSDCYKNMQNNTPVSTPESTRYLESYSNDSLNRTCAGYASEGNMESRRNCYMRNVECKGIN